MQFKPAGPMQGGWAGIKNRAALRIVRHTYPTPVSRLPDNVQPSRTTAISKLFHLQFKPAGPMQGGWAGIKKSCRFMNCAAHLLDSRFPSPGQRTAISDNCYFKVVSNAVQARRADGNIYSVPLYELCGTPTRFPFPVSRTTYSHLGQLLFQSCFKCSLYTITACLLKIFSSYVMIIKITTK